MDHTATPIRKSTDNNDALQLLVDGCGFYPRIFESISAAKHTIYIENYLVEEGNLFDQLFDHLIVAARRGVVVRIVMDEFGCSSGVKRRFETLNRYTNIHIKLFNPIALFKGTRNLNRTHIKLFLFDDVVAYVGGAGITDDFYNPKTERADWSEIMLRVANASVAELARYCRIKHQFLNKLGPWLKPSEVITFLGFNHFSEWLAAHHLTTHFIKQAIYSRITNAHSRIWINSAYFYPTSKLLRLLKKKARQGVDVRLLLPGESDVFFMKYLARYRYKRLIKAGVAVHEIQNRFLHSKVIIIDDWCTLGSFNLDIFSLQFNHELNYSSSDEALVKELEGFYLAKLHSSKEYLLDEWKNRGLYTKFMEKLSHFITHFLRRFL
jgi:phosphatidylserine/phosphatidylglycerophosphate/cardiolipin synthase-like enzyme